MNLAPGLPGKSFEGGIELFSETNELDLIRSWLPEAPDTVRISRVVHRVRDEGDVFTVCCEFEPVNAETVDAVAMREEICRVCRLWAAHTAPLDLPKLTWVESREIQLEWRPKALESKGRDELSTAERVELDFQLETSAASPLCVAAVASGSPLPPLGSHPGGHHYARHPVCSPKPAHRTSERPGRGLSTALLLPEPQVREFPFQH